MEILSSAQTIQGVNPKVIETPNYIVLNTQVYEKGSFTPVPFNFYVRNDQNYIFQLYRMITTMHNTNAGHISYVMQAGSLNTKRIVFDNRDSKKYYQMHQYRNTSGQLKCLYEMIENEKIIISQKFSHNYDADYNYTGARYCGSGNTSGGTNYYPICQTKDYFVYVNTYPTGISYDWSVSGTRVYTIQRVDKITYSIIDMLAYTGYTTGMIFDTIYLKDDDILYLYKYTRNTINVIKTQVSTNMSSTIFSTTVPGTYYTGSNITIINGYFWSMMVEVDPDTSDKLYVLYRVSINYNTDAISFIKVPINTNGFLLDTSSGQNFDGITDGVYHNMFSFESDGNNYIIVVIHSLPNFVYYPDQHKIIVMKLSSDNESATVVSVERLKTGCKGVMEFVEGDPTTLVTLHAEGYKIFKFNHTLEKYELVYAKGDVFYAIGFDSYGRFYTQNSNNQIEVITSQNAIILKADFEEERYTKNNGNIITNVYYYAKNIFNEYIGADVTLSLIGNVKFQDNTKIKTVRTSIFDIDRLPVIIYGTGKIEVLINIA